MSSPPNFRRLVLNMTSEYEFYRSRAGEKLSMTNRGPASKIVNFQGFASFLQLGWRDFIEDSVEVRRIETKGEQICEPGYEFDVTLPTTLLPIT